MCSYEFRLGKMGPYADGRMEQRRKNLEVQIGHSWSLEVNVEGPSVRKKDLYHTWVAGCEQSQGAGRVWPMDLRLSCAVEEDFVQD
jgi:hypothetical protein